MSMFHSVRGVPYGKMERFGGCNLLHVYPQVFTVSYINKKSTSFLTCFFPRDLIRIRT